MAVAAAETAVAVAATAAAAENMAQKGRGRKSVPLFCVRKIIQVRMILLWFCTKENLHFRQKRCIIFTKSRTGGFIPLNKELRPAGFVVYQLTSISGH